MNLHSDFEDDYPEGIDAGVAFDTSTLSTREKISRTITAFIVVGLAFYAFHALYSYLYGAALYAVLMVSSWM